MIEEFNGLSFLMFEEFDGSFLIERECVYWTVQKLRCLNWSKPTLDSAVIKVPWWIPNCGRALDNYFLRQECGLRAEAHFASQNMLLLGNTLHCELLLKRTVFFKSAPYSLLLNTLYPSSHFAYWNIFLLGTLLSNPLCFLQPFAAHHTLLLSPLYSLSLKMNI